MPAADPIILDVPDGGVGTATLEWTTATPDAVHAFTMNVSRGWVDLKIGASSGAGDITTAHFSTAALRLYPGYHVIQVTPGVSPFYVTATRNREGLTAITDMMTVGQAGDLVLESPYEEEDLNSLRFAQSRDVRWVFNYRHTPRAVVRHSNTSWGLIYWQPDDGPFLQVNDDKITLTPAAVSGADVALTASEDFFQSGHITGLVQLTHPGQRVAAAITAEDTFTTAVRVSGIEDGRIFTLTISGTFTATVTLQRSVGVEGNWSDVAPTYTAAGVHQIDDGYDNSVIYYRVGVKAGAYTSGAADVEIVYAAGETQGVGRIVSVTDGQTATIDILTPFGAAQATRYWAEGAWSGVRGHPAAGDIYDGRLWVGSVLSMWGSAPDNFAGFAIGSEDDDAVGRDIAVGDASPIVWIKGAFRLQVGVNASAADIDAVRIGEGASLQVRSSSFDEPITPTNMTMRDVSARLGYIDASRRKLMRLSFDLDTNTFVADDLTRLHEDISGPEGSGGFIDLTYQGRPQPRVWLPRADGQLACLTLAEAEQVVGWTRVKLGQGSLRQAEIDAALAAEEEGWEDETAAMVRSASAIPGVASTEAAHDFVHVIVDRVLNGQGARMHERIESERWADQDDAWFVECGLKYDGEPASYISGLDHLLGETVAVWGDGANAGLFEVEALADAYPDVFDDGEIGVFLGDGVEVSTAIIGLPMKTRYMSGKLPYGAAAGSAVGETKKLGQKLNVLFYKTALAGVLYGVADANDPQGADVWFDESRLIRVDELFPDLISMDERPLLYTGELPLTVDCDHMTDPRIVFVFDGPGPAAILGYVVNMVANESP